MMIGTQLVSACKHHTASAATPPLGLSPAHGRSTPQDMTTVCNTLPLLLCHPLILKEALSDLRLVHLEPMRNKALTFALGHVVPKTIVCLTCS